MTTYPVCTGTADDYVRIDPDHPDRIQIRGTMYPADGGYPGNKFTPADARNLANRLNELADQAENAPVRELADDIMATGGVTLKANAREIARILHAQGYRKKRAV